ncbi:hypothetical protein DDI_1672 [Dickeya dianthicola RNS04.9]|nr:hypothetical protein DDI_1672 [Dickeya dianthicola RNS04.9]
MSTITARYPVQSGQGECPARTPSFWRASAPLWSVSDEDWPAIPGLGIA